MRRPRPSVGYRIGVGNAYRWGLPMADTQKDWETWVSRLAEGDEDVVAEFWRRYGRRLEMLAVRHMTGALCRREGPDDVVQSVFRTFFRRARSGQFDLPEQECLWRLLCAITMTKIHEKERFHRRQKRHMDREQDEAANRDDAPRAIDHLAASDPDPEKAAEFADILDQLLAGFSEDKRAVVELKLQKFTNAEIAERLRCSEHTVRRILKHVQKRLQTILKESSL